MEINYKINREHLFRTLSDIFIRTNKFRKLRLILTLLSGIIASAVCYLFKKFLLKYYSLLIIVLIIIAVMILYFLVCKTQIHIQFKGIIKKFYESNDYNYVFLPTTLELTSDYIKYTNEHVVNKLNWNSIIAIYEIIDYFIIDINSETTLFIPLDTIINKDIFISIITNNTNIEIKKEYPRNWIYCK